MPKHKFLEGFRVEIDKIQVVHEYRRLVRQGFLPPLTHTCGEEYTPRVYTQGEEKVLFQCFHCDAIVDLGLADYKGMLARIEDHKAKRDK